MLVFDATKGKRRPIEALAFHPDGKRLAAGGGDNTWTTVHDATTGAQLTAWFVRSQRIPHNIVFHPEGQLMYAACGTCGLSTVRVTSGGTSTDLQAVYAVTVSPGGERIIVDGADDRIASLRAGPRTSPIAQWEIHIDGGEGWRSQRQAFFPDGERFVSAEYVNRPTGPADAQLVIRSATDG